VAAFLLLFVAFSGMWNPVFRPTVQNARVDSVSGLCETALAAPREDHQMDRRGNFPQLFNQRGDRRPQQTQPSVECWSLDGKERPCGYPITGRSGLQHCNRSPSKTLHHKRASCFSLFCPGVVIVSRFGGNWLGGGAMNWVISSNWANAKLAERQSFNQISEARNQEDWLKAWRRWALELRGLRQQARSPDTVPPTELESVFEPQSEHWAS
jgi:hypothetical protein